MAGVASHTAWTPPPKALRLGPDEVHVWRVGLDASPSRLESLERTLAPDERTRAGNLALERARRRFVAGRGALRLILGGCLDVDPRGLRFRYGARGKPELEPLPGGGGLSFSVSHSRGLALCAVARGRRVGVDLERVREDLAAEPIAARFFSPREAAALRALPAQARIAGFFNCWTRKEAFVKATGEGVSRPLDHFDVSLGPGEPAALLSVEGDPGAAARWSLRELDPGSGYAAALALEGRRWRLDCWQWG